MIGNKEGIFLEGKVIVVMGVGSGIGRVSVVMMGFCGVKFVLVDFNEQIGEEMLVMVCENGGDVIFVQVDVFKESDV